MAALLQGDISAAEETVVQGQLSEFQRWLKVDYTASLERKALTSNPTFTLQMNSLDYESTLVSVALLTAKGPPIQFVQIWKRASDGSWHFAPAETRRHLEAVWAEEWKRADFSH